MDWYATIKTLHIISATVLFGTGLGIAFFMFRSCFADNLHEKYYAIRNTVLADYCFTAPAVIIQPLTGAWLVWQGGFNWSDQWLVTTYILYITAGLCWLPVVWIQIQLKNYLKQAVEDHQPLPAKYNQLFKIWFCLGWPAFFSLLVIFHLMVSKPV